MWPIRRRAQKLLNSREVVTLLDTEVGAKHWKIGLRIASAVVVMAPLSRSGRRILLMHIAYIPLCAAGVRDPHEKL